MHTHPHVQVASHAQKYFIRLNSMNKKDKRRASIHDITSNDMPPGRLSSHAALPLLMPQGVSLMPHGFSLPQFMSQMQG